MAQCDFFVPEIEGVTSKKQISVSRRDQREQDEETEGHPYWPTKNTCRSGSIIGTRVLLQIHHILMEIKQKILKFNYTE